MGGSLSRRALKTEVRGLMWLHMQKAAESPLRLGGRAPLSSGLREKRWAIRKWKSLEGNWSLGNPGLRRRNRDLLALKSAFQRRDAGGDTAFSAVFQRHSGAQGLGITVRVVTRPQVEKLLGHGVLARCLCEKSALGRRRIDRRGRSGTDEK
jgi:hypothetical protein